MSDNYRFPTREEKQLGPELVGKKVAIYWDGDKVYYPATLTGYDENTQKFCVEYEEDSTNEKYNEDLKSSGWKIWAGTDAEYAAERENKREALTRGAKTDAVEKLAQSNQPAASGSSSSSRMSYTSMVIEAVEKLADRYGSSIQAVRKYVTNNFPLKQQQTASFNSLTLKALSKAVALEVLEIDKRLYRISAKEKERRRDKDKALRAAASAASRDALAMRYKKGTTSNGRGSGTMNTDMLGVEAGDPLLLSFYGTAAAYNKSLRKELINVRTKRDRFLQARMKILKPFLIDKNYFFRKDRLEIERRKEKEAKRLELKQLAAKQQAAIAASNIYATAYTSTPAMSSYTAQNGLAYPQSATSSAGVPGAVPAGAYAPGYGYPASGYPVPGAPAAYYPNQPMQHANGDVGLPIDAQQSQQSQYVNTAGYPPMPAYHTAVPHVYHTLPAAVAPMVDAVSSSSSSASVPAPALALVAAPVTAAVTPADEEGTPVEDEEDEVVEPEIDEKQLVYSTMEGVKLLPQPHILKAELHEHQIQGISWMVHMFQNGMPMILGDQMGLGKTIQSIGFMACLQQHLNKKGPFLVVVPLSVLSNWISEIERFCPSFRAVRFHGPKNERNRIKEEELSDLSEFDIVVTTYEILVSEINFFRRKYVWTAVIVDEGHRLKNEKSQFSEKLRLIACLSKVILSGTPLQNNLKELWAMLYYLAPDVFQSSKPFEEGFDLTRGHIDSVVLRKARKLLSVFMLRRLKEHVAIKLPSRRELTLLVPLTKQQHELYKQYLCSLDSSTLEVVMREETPAARSNAQSTNNLQAAAGDTVMTTITAVSNGHRATASSSSAALTDLVPVSAPITGAAADSDWRKLMNLLLQLRKICNHTYLLPDIAPDPYEVNEDIVGGSGKLMMLDRMLPMLRRNGHRVLIFSQFTSMLDLLEDYCELRDYPFVRLDGETNRVKRRLDVRRFNAPRSPLFIFLISTRAGGLGLNLASADTVILYDSDWNPQVDLQAMERAHRIGQVKPVRVYRLVCRGSVEERMVSRAEKKLFLNAMVAEADPDEQLHEADGAEEQSEDARRQAEISEALGIGGTAISKGELASLIRFGANAVFEGSVDNIQKDGGSGNQISDEELDTLLEMQGRDIPRAPKVIEAGSSDATNAATSSTSSSVIAPVVNAADDLDDLAKAQQALRDRMQMLKEVDLRQLGSTIYDKKKRKSTAKGEAADLDSSAIIPGILDTKRIRKERVIMVDGKGTGYGGAVPVLAETMEKEVVVHDDPDGLKFRSRGRQWSHQSFCCMCGKCAEVPTPPVVVEPAAGADAKKIKKEDIKTGKLSRVSSAVDLAVVPAPDNSTAPVKCAHCPFIFHLACCNGPPPSPPTAEELRAAGNKRKVEPPLTRPAGMFICAHHRCCICNRSTASAGGLLFRCTGCMTAYCEDCLPQDEIDSVGRCRPLEKLGYNSKQSYYIRCPYCCQLDGFKPTGILNDNDEAVAQAKKQDQRDASALSRGQSRTSLTGNRSMVSLASMGGDRDGASDDGAGEDEIMEGAEEAQVAEPEPAEEPIVPLKTQLMRLHWAEVRDPTPEPSPIKKKKGKKGKGKKGKKGAKAAASTSSKRKSSEESASESESEDEESDAPEPVDSLSEAAAMWREWASPSAASSTALSKSKKGKVDVGKVPEDCPADKAMQILLEHPLWLALRHVRLVAGQISSTAEAADGDLQMFAHVFNKIESRRYRSSALLVNDVRFAIENNITKKVRSKLTKDSERTKFAELQALFTTFLDVEFAMNVVV